jgi:NAD(P)-dependent dehydrogenase (short-subunit alcohol dehydrogenase family)
MEKIGLNQALEDHMIGTIPLARFGKPGEIAKLITFLSSEDAAFITGSEY